MKYMLISTFFLSFQFLFGQEILVSQIQIACGNSYFWESETTQPPMIVQGQWCGDSFFWAPVGIGRTLSEEAFMDGVPFNGNAVAKNKEGELIGNYIFNNGFIEKLEEFYKGQLILSCQYSNGIPNGEHIAYDISGSITNVHTYKTGILHGKYYSFRNGDFGDCVREGIANNGEVIYSKNTCD